MGEGKVLAWRDVQSLLDNLNISGSGSGLTPFQLTNHLVALKIVDPPTAVDISDWIYKHPKLGAFCALKDLGFSVSKKNLMSVQGAFTCIYCFLEEHLTEQDKSLLFFSPIFVEHVLCMIPRWKARLADKDAEGRLKEKRQQNRITFGRLEKTSSITSRFLCPY